MLNLLKLNYCDIAERWQMGIQDPASPIAEGMLFFHNYLMMYIIFIGCFVFFMLFSAYQTNSTEASKFSHSNILEIVWTVIPALTLIIIAVPSFSLLYSLDDIVEPDLTIKVIGHQWYWSYEYDDRIPFVQTNFTSIRVPVNYDSYMLSDTGRNKKLVRLLSVDETMYAQINTHIRLLVTSSDVLHSWAVPSFGIKIDATPGRLSQVSLFIKRSGIFYGQCSEICGVNHGFMPIVVKVAEVGASNDKSKSFPYTVWIHNKELSNKLTLFRSFLKSKLV